MKKQLQKLKLGVESLSRPNKADKNSEELLAAEQQIENYKFVFDKIVKKCLPFTGSTGGVIVPITSNSSAATGSVGYLHDNASNSSDILTDHLYRDKRFKKLHEYRLANAMSESANILCDGLLHDVLFNCAVLERNIAREIVDNEYKIEKSVTCKLTEIMDKHLTIIQKQKRIVSKLMQDNDTAKYKHLLAVRVNESASKIIQLREEQEECENRLEKERDIWATEMYELIAKEQNMADYIVNYVTAQRLYYKSALEQIEEVLSRVDGIIRNSNKRIFNVALNEHLLATDRKIAYVIEMCVCCLLERGINEEGLLRVGCAGSKLRRFRSALDANKAKIPLPPEYMDVHVIASILKQYLRNLPDPLLTFQLYDEFVSAARFSTEEQCKKSIRHAIQQLPVGNYENLRYLTKFLSRLSDNSDINKMSAHNIAIVMAPNLLWSENIISNSSNEINTDYLDHVNSSTVINRILEMVVSDWSFFFNGEVNFFQTFRREDLFNEKENTASLISVASDVNIGESIAVSKSNISPFTTTSSSDTRKAMEKGAAHSLETSNSHDIHFIITPLDTGFKIDPISRSLSNSSLSDTSIPHGENSPKLPTRRKHNKPAAPTPPDTRFKNTVQTAQNVDGDGCGKINSLADLQMNKPTNAVKPAKPPRPIFDSIECRTLNRAQYRSAKESTSSSVQRPSALPRSNLFTNRSSENVSDTGTSVLKDHVFCKSDAPLLVQNSNKLTGKPVIPTRPISLRPHSHNPQVRYSTSIGSTNCDSECKVNVSNIGHTTLAKTHIYNVDKNQVSIIERNSNVSCDILSPTTTKSNVPSKNNIPVLHRPTINMSVGRFDPLIKRPQIPAPPPPIATTTEINNADSADSTNL